jgi:L-glutamine-phosphate cytidylyltransferase
MQVVILAAGKGTRLGAMTRQLPKPMVLLCGKPIIWYVLRPLLQHPAIDEIVIVTGFQRTVLETYVRETFTTARNIRLLQHTAYDTGNLFTFLHARSSLHTTFMIANADHIFRLPLLTQLIETATAPQPGVITIGCHHDRPLTPDDMKVQLTQGRLTQISKTLTVYDAGYLGLTIVPEVCREAYFAHAEATVRDYGEASVVEQVLLQAAQHGMPAQACDLTGLGWYEIDTPEDHAIATAALTRETSWHGHTL